MIKHSLLPGLVCCLLLTISTGASQPASLVPVPDSFNWDRYTKALLSGKDLPGYKLKSRNTLDWCTVDKSGKIVRTKGPQQAWLTPEGREIYSWYGFFGSSAGAIRAAEGHIPNVAAVFREGTFSGRRLGNRAWHSEGVGAGLLVAQGPVLFLMSDPACPQGERKRLEEIAEKALAKIKGKLPLTTTPTNSSLSTRADRPATDIGAPSQQEKPKDLQGGVQVNQNKIWTWLVGAAIAATVLVIVIILLLRRARRRGAGADMGK